MNFGQAVEALKNDKPVRRSDWRDGVFVFRQVPSIIGKDVVPKMQSLPNSVKKIFQSKFEDPAAQVAAIYYTDQLAIVDSSLFIRGYTPTVSDALAEDWMIVE